MSFTPLKDDGSNAPDDAVFRTNIGAAAASHTHSIANVTGLQTALDGKKADSMATNKLLGRGTAGTGAIEEITLGTNLSLSGTTLNATGGGGGGTWGSITGTLSNQTDLNSALAGKQQTLTNYSSIAALTGYPLSFSPSSHTHSPSDITGTAVITSDARLSDERVPTSAGIASKTNGASAATPNDSDLIPIAESSSSLKKLSLTNLWTWITTKIGAITSITAGGAWSFTSTTRPTSSGTGTPAATSLITLTDGDSRYLSKINAASTQQIDATNNTAGADVTGLTGIALESNATYEYTFHGTVTSGASGGFLMWLVYSQNLAHTANGWIGGWFTGNTSGSGPRSAYQDSSTSIKIVYATESRTSSLITASGVFRTGANAPTVKVQFAQNASNATTSSLASGAVLHLRKIS